MSNPNTPAIASSPAFPPSIQLPFGELRGGQVFLNSTSLQLLQYLYAQVSGGGGVGDSIALSLLGALAGGGGAAAIDQLESNQLAPIQFHDVSPSPIAWTPYVAGSTTPGAQTYSVQWGQACYIGPLVLVQFAVVMTAKDGTTAGNVTIANLPQVAKVDAAVQAGWLSSYSNVTIPGGRTQLGIDLSAGVTDLLVVASGSAAGSTPLTAAGIAANTALKGGCLYFR